MPDILIADIPGANLANISNAFSSGCNRFIMRSPPKLTSKPTTVVLPGNGCFGSYVDFLYENNWKALIGNILNEEKSPHKLIAICAGFQALGISSQESSSASGLAEIPICFENILNRYEMKTNLGRQNIHKLVPGNSAKDSVTLPDANPPYFVHSYACFDYQSIASDSKYSSYNSFLGSKSFLSALVSPKLFASQFHPELSGPYWRAFMLRFAG